MFYDLIMENFLRIQRSSHEILHTKFAALVRSVGNKQVGIDVYGFGK